MPGRDRPSRQALHDRLQAAIIEPRERLSAGRPDLHEAEAIWTDIWFHEAHSSTAESPGELAPTQPPTVRRGHGSARLHCCSHLDNDWLALACRVSSAPVPIVEAVAQLHGDFERIHPFIDGNGRAGRLLLNLLLVRLGYPPAIIQKRERPKYLEALRRADEGDAGLLGEIIARTVLDNLLRFILPGGAGPAKLVPLESLADLGITVPALRAAASRGRLRAVRAPDGGWRSSRAWVADYLAGRYRRSQGKT